MGQEGKPWAARFSSGGTYLFPRSSARWPLPPGSAALPATPGGARCGAGTDLSQPTLRRARQTGKSAARISLRQRTLLWLCRDMSSRHEMEGVKGEGGAGHLYGALAGKD